MTEYVSGHLVLKSIKYTVWGIRRQLAKCCACCCWQTLEDAAMFVWKILSLMNKCENYHVVIFTTATVLCLG